MKLTPQSREAQGYRHVKYNLLFQKSLMMLQRIRLSPPIQPPVCTLQWLSARCVQTHHTCFCREGKWWILSIHTGGVWSIRIGVHPKIWNHLLPNKRKLSTRNVQKKLQSFCDYEILLTVSQWNDETTVCAVSGLGPVPRGYGLPDLTVTGNGRTKPCDIPGQDSAMQTSNDYLH